MGEAFSRGSPPPPHCPALESPIPRAAGKGRLLRAPGGPGGERRGAKRAPSPAVPCRGAGPHRRGRLGHRCALPSHALCARGLPGAAPALVPGSGSDLPHSGGRESPWRREDSARWPRGTGTVAPVARFGKNRNPERIFLSFRQCQERKRNPVFCVQTTQPHAHSAHRVKSSQRCSLVGSAVTRC